jgi:hypothetical protein
MSHSEPTENEADSKGQAQVPEPEVVPRAKRRKFTAEYKLRILEEADAWTERGQVGALQEGRKRGRRLPIMDLSQPAK